MSDTKKPNERGSIITMDVSSAIAPAVPREGMNDLYQKIDKYLYEIRMIELDEYLYGMNGKKIDKKKAYEIIIDAHDSEWNPVTNVWKARMADPDLSGYKSSRVEKNESIANAFYRKAVDLNIEGLAEAGDQYACVCLGMMHFRGRGVDRSYLTAVEWYRKAAEQGHANAQFLLGSMYHFGEGIDRNFSTAASWYRKAAERGHVIAQWRLT